MALTYGFVKAKILGIAPLKPTHRQSEIQYHTHLTLEVAGGNWDVAINVGTNDSDDLLKYKLVYDFHHPITETLSAAPPGFTDLTDKPQLPALDFLRGDVLSETGPWRQSDPIDGTEQAEPVRTLLRLFETAKQGGLFLYVFGRRYINHDGSPGRGVHDTHMNQGSSGEEFLHRPGDDRTDHNDVWQDGAVMADLGNGQWAAYFAAFDQQTVPTDDLGNPQPGGKTIS